MFASLFKPGARVRISDAGADLALQNVDPNNDENENDLLDLEYPLRAYPDSYDDADSFSGQAISTDSRFIDGSLYMDESHYMAFARKELERMKLSGRVANNPLAPPPPPRRQPAEDDDDDDAPIVSDGSSSVTLTPLERQFRRAIAALRPFFPSLVVARWTSSVSSNVVAGLESLPSCLDVPSAPSAALFLVATYHVSSRDPSVARAALRSLRSLLKSQRKSSLSPPSKRQPPAPSPWSIAGPAPDAPLPFGGDLLPLDGVVHVLVPLVLSRIGERRTPKDLQSAACKCLLALSRSTALPVDNALAPYLTSEKLPLRSRLLFAKLLLSSSAPSSSSSSSLQSSTPPPPSAGPSAPPSAPPHSPTLTPRCVPPACVCASRRPNHSERTRSVAAC